MAFSKFLVLLVLILNILLILWLGFKGYSAVWLVMGFIAILIFYIENRDNITDMNEFLLYSLAGFIAGAFIVPYYLLVKLLIKEDDKITPV